MFKKYLGIFETDSIVMCRKNSEDISKKAQNRTKACLTVGWDKI
jgi:hypothetical protein